MTKEEFCNLSAHSRIKYIGSDEALKAVLVRHSSVALTKGVVVSWTVDKAKSSWSSEKEQGLVLYLYSGPLVKNIIPEDWIVVDAKRVDLARAREKRAVKATDSRVRRELNQFSESFRNMKNVKARIDEWLENVPFASRFQILASLTEEQKAWLDLLDLPPEEVIALIKKASGALSEGKTLEVKDE